MKVVRSTKYVTSGSEDDLGQRCQPRSTAVGRDSSLPCTAASFYLSRVRVTSMFHVRFQLYSQFEMKSRAWLWLCWFV